MKRIVCVFAVLIALALAATANAQVQTGSILVSGPCADLAKDARVREAYLGRAAARAG